MWKLTLALSQQFVSAGGKKGVVYGFHIMNCQLIIGYVPGVKHHNVTGLVNRLNWSCFIHVFSFVVNNKYCPPLNTDHFFSVLQVMNSEVLRFYFTVWALLDHFFMFFMDNGSHTKLSWILCNNTLSQLIIRGFGPVWTSGVMKGFELPSQILINLLSDKMHNGQSVWWYSYRGACWHLCVNIHTYHPQELSFKLLLI